ncbi:right-handed parallel beta-helix repeat-containing protein [Actinacidiphila soli]|jgi:parallel beta-helix repeat protein|uniref:right-handed parallel beta-helix repeat-containing protein n=1 Tax=Actinacidiphila soli TaxID=2487275 RepID=UPI001F0BDD4B|nr:right-handed parallel beta-helix repeat-containing protein [Actinacidiphila soli]
MAAHAADRIVVRPGESIQAAVDRAKPGDVVSVEPGVYRGSVQVTVPRLTLTGSGPGTVIAPSAAGTENACAVAGHGLCVTGTADHEASDVRLREFSVVGFKKNGVNATWADRIEVRQVTARDNGQQGISLEKSVHGTFRNNDSENNGESGILLANTVDSEGGALDTQGAVVRDNRLTGNRVGVVLRRVRNMVVENNRITDNCGGVFVVGDEGVPRAGSLTVRGNLVAENNKYCKPNGRLPFIQGVGILLTGAENTLVTGNQVLGNAGTSPMSGGVVLFRSNVGVANSGNTIRQNIVQGNAPADLADRDTGAGNTFSGNSCRASEPTGRCAAL